VLIDSPARYVIANADDFGMSRGVNEGVLRAHREGIVTSASLLVRWPAAREAAQASRDNPRLSLGLHADLGEWAFQNDTWMSLYSVVSLDDAGSIRSELMRQLESFCQLVGTQPSHLDSHQHVHCHEPARSMFIELAVELGIPLRQHSPVVRHCGSFYGQTGKGEPLAGAISVESLRRILSELPSGISELSCHPGSGEALNTMYAEERLEETETLCDASIRHHAEEQGIEFISFWDISDAPGAARSATSSMRGHAQGDGVP
jgi:predicted glycoside hydrolase/deacetylase ChbG (UPF0249 family)